MIKSIHEIVRDVKQNYEYDNIDTVEGMEFNMHDRIVENEFLSNSRYVSGDYDDNGDLKPFHDIITRILENAGTAEDVDTKDFPLKTNDPDYYVRARILNAYNQDWMQEKHMDQFHNLATETRRKHGGLLVKVVESAEDLNLEVVDWTNFAGDAADLESGIKVIRNFYTPSALITKGMEMGWDMEAVNRAIELYAEADQDDEYKEQKETTGKYILVREVSGVIERQYLDENAPEFEYSYQVHYLAGSEFHSDKGGEQGVTLDAFELDESLYYYLPYVKRTIAGKTLGVGLVERSRHAQIATNVAAQQYKHSLDLASTHVLQSASKNLKGKNVLTNMKRGTILKVDDGKPVSGVDMSPQALAHLDRYMQQWQIQVDRATSTFAVATGEELPSGTPYRLGAILDQNAQSSFDKRREEYGIFINRIYQERIIPFFIRQIKKKKTLSLKFDPEQLMEMDKDTAQYRADKQIISEYLNGDFDGAPPAMKMALIDVRREELMNDVNTQLKRGKDRRNISEFPKGYWEGVANKVYAEVTNEKRDKGRVLETINTALMQYAQLKPLLETDKNARKMFNDLLAAAGQPPLKFEDGIQQPQQQAPQQQPQRGKTALDQPEELTAKPQ